jgi:hypothetical protein
MPCNPLVKPWQFDIYNCWVGGQYSATDQLYVFESSGGKQWQAHASTFCSELNSTSYLAAT